MAVCLDENLTFGDALDKVRHDSNFWNTHVYRPAERAVKEAEASRTDQLKSAVVSQVQAMTWASRMGPGLAAK